MGTTPTRAIEGLLLGIGIATAAVGITKIDNYIFPEGPTAAQETYDSLDIGQTVQTRSGEATITRLEDALSVRTSAGEVIDFGANGTPDRYITTTGEVFDLTADYQKPLNDYLKENFELLKNGN